MSAVFIALGSNINQPWLQLVRGVRALSYVRGLELRQCSLVYRSVAVGPEQPCFLNAVVRVEYFGWPERLLLDLKHIEAHQGRDRDIQRWGPRSLDLDIIWWQSLVWRSAQLTVPHSEAFKRLFVMAPWASICPYHLDLYQDIKHTMIKDRSVLVGAGCFVSGFLSAGY